MVRQKPGVKKAAALLTAGYTILVMIHVNDPRGRGTAGRQLGVTVSLALVLLGAPGCWSDRESPESRVRTTVMRAETLAEAKDLAGLKDLVSDGYRDDAGQDKRAIMGLLFVQFRRHESIHLLTRIDRVDIQEGRAAVTVFAAMAGRPIPSASDLPALSADLYRFDLRLADERGAWRVTTAAWRPALLSDFFPSEAEN